MATPERGAYRHSIGIAADHPAYAGHFPGMPILPGALLLDEALRIIEMDLGIDITEWQLTAAKFLMVVRPGDALTIEHSAVADGSLRFAVRVADRAALSGSLARAGAGAGAGAATGAGAGSTAGSGG
jgi:3-hydroxymyristoyl/3-hydroxydecanoyl-(acyl carrier protein) dehydratase